MFNAFNLPSLFFGIFLTIPLLLGLILFPLSYMGYGSQTKAQHVAGILFLTDALYLIIRTHLLANHDVGSEMERTIYYVADSTIITIFGLVPYTIIFEKYPKWWHYLIALSPLVLIPLIYLTGFHALSMWSHMLPILIGIAIVIYLSKYITKIDNQLSNYFANPELHAKSWVIYISIGYLILTFMSMLRYVIPGHVGYNMTITLSWSIIMILLFIFLIRQKPAELSDKDSLIILQQDTVTNKPAKAPSTEISSETKERVNESIKQALMEKCVEEKLYLNRDLNLYALARACNTNRTYLTDYLHEQLHQTFYEYINTLRLKHVDELLEKTKLSQENIALQCGFNSSRTMRNVYQKLKGKELTRP